MSVRRTGIDLSPARCTVVDAETSSRGRKHGERTSVRIHNFAALGRPESAQALTAELRTLADAKAFPRRAWVTLWDVRSSHQYVRLPADRQNDLENVARQHGASVLGLGLHGISVGAMQGVASQADGKIDVSLFAAASHDIRNKLRPIQEAGFTVEGVATPCGALWAQARLRKSAVPGEVHAYVALGVARSALAIVSDGFLLYAREVPWGYADPSVDALTPFDAPTPRHRDDLATRLAVELRQAFLYLKQYWEEDVSQVLLCGDMPEIRSLTAPLIERLNIEVETLDSLDGIDTTALPEPAARFADQVASLRLAAAVAVEPPPVNLLPVRVTVQRESRRSQIVLVAGSAAAVAFGAFLYAQASARATAAERDVAALQSQMESLQPRVRAIEAAASGAGAEHAQQAALAALDAQGPRMARVLETLARDTPRDVSLRSVHIIADGPQWRVSSRGVRSSGLEISNDVAVPR